MLKRVFSLIIVLCILCYCAIPSYACIRETGSLPQEELDRTVKYWRQGVVPADNSLIHSETDRTIRRAACSHFSMAYALVKMGILVPSNGDTPITHIIKAREYHAFRVNWGYYEFAKAPEMYPGVQYLGVDYNVDGLSASEGLAYVKGKMQEGYYVIACVRTQDTNGHCIFFDGINEDGTTSIGDSWANGLTWEHYYGASGTQTVWGYLELLKCESKPFNEQPSIYEETELRDVTDEEVEEYNTLVARKGLTGMPKTTDLAQYARVPNLPDIEGLTQSDVNSLTSIKHNLADKKLSLGEFGSAVASFFGIVLIVYGVLLLLAFLFDSVNSFIDISLVTLLTLGFVKVVRDKNDYEKDKAQKGYVTILKLAFIIIVVVIIGVLLLNGTVLKLLYKIVGGVG